MFGTANVVNVLKGGVFIGGAIAPGYALQIDALFSGIPHLRNFSPKIPDAPVGTNTAEAIGAGIYWSHLMWLSAMKGYFDVDRVLITGGGAGAVRHLIQMLGFEFVATLIPMGMVSLLKRKKGGL
jgi:pantothenate kinase type III